jgi:hypothetical protein
MDDGVYVPGAADLSGTSGAWYYDARGASCSVLSEGKVLAVLTTATCCDVIPPQDLPCFFGVSAAQTVPSELAGFLRLH